MALISLFFPFSHFIPFISLLYLSRLLLGLTAELFYIREGKVNDYALKFVVPVPPHISELHFSWQSLITTPVRTMFNDNGITLKHSQEKMRMEKQGADERKYEWRSWQSLFWLLWRNAFVNSAN